MSRFNAVDNGDDYPVPPEFWQHNWEQTLKGKRGRKALEDLRKALTSLPKRELSSGSLIELNHDEEDYEKVTVENVCAIGAYALYKGMDPKELENWDGYYGDEGDCWSTAEAGKKAGMTYTMAWEIARLNDERYGYLSDSSRWWAMYGWVTAQLNNRELPTNYLRGMGNASVT